MSRLGQLAGFRFHSTCVPGSYMWSGKSSVATWEKGISRRSCRAQGLAVTPCLLSGGLSRKRLARFALVFQRLFCSHLPLTPLVNVGGTVSVPIGHLQAREATHTGLACPHITPSHSWESRRPFIRDPLHKPGSPRGHHGIASCLRPQQCHCHRQGGRRGGGAEETQVQVRPTAKALRRWPVSL